MCDDALHRCGLCERRQKVISVDRSNQKTQYSQLECGHLHVFHGVGKNDILWSEPGDEFTLMPSNWLRMSVNPKNGYFSIDEAQFQGYEKRDGLFSHRNKASLFCETYVSNEDVRFARKRWYGMIAQEGMKGMMQAIDEIVPDWHENTRLIRVQLIGFALALFPSETSQLFVNEGQVRLFAQNMLPTPAGAYAI
jgi:hypothetical protein